VSPTCKLASRNEDCAPTADLAGVAMGDAELTWREECCWFWFWFWSSWDCSSEETLKSVTMSFFSDPEVLGVLRGTRTVEDEPDCADVAAGPVRLKEGTGPEKSCVFFSRNDERGVNLKEFGAEAAAIPDSPMPGPVESIGLAMADPRGKGGFRESEGEAFVAAEEDRASGIPVTLGNSEEDIAEANGAAELKDWGVAVLVLVPMALFG
jgi:hypothetical protein